jgi:type IV pilus assembly protein PilW
MIGASPMPRARLGLARQAGYSMIELIIAIAIAIFLIGGVMIVEQSMHNSYTDQSGLAQIEDTERFTMTMLSEITQSAGYYPDPAKITASTALPQDTTNAPNATNDALSFQPEQLVDGVAGSATVNGATVGNDTLAVRYMTDSGDGISMCDGSTNSSGGPVAWVNYFYVESDATGSYLYCVVQNETNAGAWGTPVQLASNVQAMQIWYGLSTTGGTSVDTYVPAADMTTSAQWMEVSSVKVLLTYTNPLYAKLNGQGQPPVLLFTKVIDIMSRTGS